ncbi:hypothetical protein [Plantactinospora sonchi]|uniref:Uncharacterized protein n=1 Tax=Plantactinospora sonchi TaxID=1544735 RepID=A0ABU7RP46_9ACTN
MTLRRKMGIVAALVTAVMAVVAVSAPAQAVGGAGVVTTQDILCC